MVDRDVLSVRLDALEGYLAELRPFREKTETEFVATPAIHLLAERLLHLACESVADLAHHVIAGEGYRQPASYREAMTVLAEEGVVAGNLARRLEDWMGFRNVLVHLYLEIDHRRSYRAIVEDLGDLEELAAALGELLVPDDRD